MSSNFWASSHARYWLVARSHLQAARDTDARYASPRQLYCLGIWFANLIQKLGKRLQLRQVPIATATVLFRRFYLKNSYCETNPYLVLATCCFVAAKVEETPVHIKSVVQEAKLVFGECGIKMFPAEANKLGEMEFYLLEDLDFHLVVFHPYRSLLHITGREPADSGRFPSGRIEDDKGADEGERIRRLMGRGTGEGLMEVDEGVLQICLFLINDTYRTDVHLLYPPYVISVAVLYVGFCLTAMNNPSGTRTRSSSSQINTLASALESNQALGLPPPPNGAAEFIASFQISLPVLLACVQDIIVLYPIWEAFEPSKPAAANDKFGPEQAEVLVRRMIQARSVALNHPTSR